jgi:hypothetical protein
VLCSFVWIGARWGGTLRWGAVGVERFWVVGGPRWGVWDGRWVPVTPEGELERSRRKPCKLGGTRRDVEAVPAMEGRVVLERDECINQRATSDGMAGARGQGRQRSGSKVK